MPRRLICGYKIVPAFIYDTTYPGCAHPPSGKAAISILEHSNLSSAIFLGRHAVPHHSHLYPQFAVLRQPYRELRPILKRRGCDLGEMSGPISTTQGSA